MNCTCTCTFSYACIIMYVFVHICTNTYTFGFSILGILIEIGLLVNLMTKELICMCAIQLIDY